MLKIGETFTVKGREYKIAEKLISPKNYYRIVRDDGISVKATKRQIENYLVQEFYKEMTDKLKRGELD